MNTLLHSHQMAKKLNNTAALCIETGHYDRAISCLVEALQLSDRESIPQHHLAFGSSGGSCSKGCYAISTSACQCRPCSLEECIIFSERTPLATSTTATASTNEDNDELGQKGYIHRRPIRITPQSTQEGHNMGVTLSLIVTFNLALAHHLSALRTFGEDCISDNDVQSLSMKRSSSSSSSSACKKKTFQKILHLYELAYRWQIELEEDRFRKIRQRQQVLNDPTLHPSWNYPSQDANNTSNSSSSLDFNASCVTSIRFNMIICNNLSQIHRLVENHSKYQRCLEHLLATMMFVVATNDRNATSSTATTTTTTTSPSSTLSPRSQSRQVSSSQHIDFEGFLLNTTSLIFQGGGCAGAA